MSKKIAVQFRKSEKTKFKYQRIKYCKHCNSYSVLWATECDICGRKYRPIQSFSDIWSRRLTQIEYLSLGILGCLAVLCAKTITMLVTSGLAVCSLFVLFYLVKKRYAPYEKQAQFYLFVMKEEPKIMFALEKHLAAIVSDVKENNFVNAYEKLREVGYFLDNDTIKLRKVMYLNHFYLRKDMDLELETLLPTMYDKDFIEYLREVAKVKPALIKSKSIEYVVKHKAAIYEHVNGTEVIANVAGAALRMKSYVNQYKDFIIEAAEYLPKERLLRLAKMVVANRSKEWEDLYERTHSLVTSRYNFDPDFHGIF